MPHKNVLDISGWVLPTFTCLTTSMIILYTVDSSKDPGFQPPYFHLVNKREKDVLVRREVTVVLLSFGTPPSGGALYRQLSILVILRLLVVYSAADEVLAMAGIARTAERDRPFFTHSSITITVIVRTRLCPQQPERDASRKFEVGYPVAISVHSLPSF